MCEFRFHQESKVVLPGKLYCYKVAYPDMTGHMVAYMQMRAPVGYWNKANVIPTEDNTHGFYCYLRKRDAVNAFHPDPRNDLWRVEVKGHCVFGVSFYYDTLNDTATGVRAEYVKFIKKLPWPSRRKKEYDKEYDQDTLDT